MFGAVGDTWFLLQPLSSRCRISHRQCVNEHGCVPVEYQLWTLKFEFLVSQNLLFNFFSTLQKCANRSEFEDLIQQVGSASLSCRGPDGICKLQFADPLHLNLCIQFFFFNPFMLPWETDWFQQCCHCKNIFCFFGTSFRASLQTSKRDWCHFLLGAEPEACKCSWARGRTRTTAVICSNNTRS